MGSAFAAFIYAAILGSIFALVYTLNRNTPVPEGCEDLKAECGGCHDISCGNHPKHSN